MKQTNRTMLAVLSAILLLFAGSLLALDNTETMVIKGELIRVDPDSQSFTVMGSNEKYIEFVYNDETKISGAADTIEGLAEEAGHPVTVYYKEETSKKMATKVEIKSEKA